MSGRRSTTSAAGTAIGAVAAAGALAFAYGSLIERNRFTVRREILPLLDAGAEPLRILHLSDFHMAPWQARKQEWISSLVDLDPDLIVDTGDNLGHLDGLSGVERALKRFAGIPGVFVHGSNDYFGPVFKNPLNYFAPEQKRHYRMPELDTDALDAVLEDTLGWTSLNNAVTSLELRGSRLELFGVNDAHRNWDRLDLLPGEIEDERENVEWDDSGADVISIGVTHSPYRRVLDAFVNNGASLILAGHTHGGQVRIPGLPALVTNCDIPREQAQGLSEWSHAGHESWLNVSAGIGTSIYAPVRFACPPEAVLITLVASDFRP